MSSRSCILNAEFGLVHLKRGKRIVLLNSGPQLKPLPMTIRLGPLEIAAASLVEFAPVFSGDSSCAPNAPRHRIDELQVNTSIYVRLATPVSYTQCYKATWVLALTKR